MTNASESGVAKRFLDQPDESSYTALFHVFSPQLIAFFRKRGYETSIAEDLAQEVMLKVYRKAEQIRNHGLFRAWLFKVARNAARRHFAQQMREVPTTDLANMSNVLAGSSGNFPGSPTFEFREWMEFLSPQEREAMTLRFVEEWEYHEIASAQAIPIGTVQWRVFNSKQRLAAHLRPRGGVAQKVA